MLSFDFEPPDPSHRLVSTLRGTRFSVWIGIHFSVFSVVSCSTALLPLRFSLVGDAYGCFPIIALAAKAVTIPNGRFTSSR